MKNGIPGLNFYWPGDFFGSLFKETGLKKIQDKKSRFWK